MATTPKPRKTRNPKTATAEKKTRRRRLQTQEDVRRALAWVATELERHDLEVPRARAMTNALGTLSAVMERTEMEARMDDLQAQLAAIQAERKET